MTDLIIGLCGDRKVGKSKAARHLVEAHGFKRLHPFDGGKAASRGYFQHLGADEEMAHRMTDGDLKDVPCPLLPIIQDSSHGTPGTHYAPRFWMEKLAKFMGVDMGPAWTLEQEVERHKSSGGPLRLVSESIVYEIDTFRKLGGIVLRLDRPLKGSDKPVGFETDKFSRNILSDHILLNDSDSVDDLHKSLDALLRDELGLMREEPDYSYF